MIQEEKTCIIEHWWDTHALNDYGWLKVHLTPLTSKQEFAKLVTEENNLLPPQKGEPKNVN